MADRLIDLSNIEDYLRELGIDFPGAASQETLKVRAELSEIIKRLERIGESREYIDKKENRKYTINKGFSVVGTIYEPLIVNGRYLKKE